jgi:hypothetical protein
VHGLITHLERVEAGEFVLVSTVDVYPAPEHVDEMSAIARADLSPYGAHRLAMEDFVQRRFPATRIIRLPALFGPGLRKNVLFDLLTSNETSMINGASQYQWYDVTRLWSDINLIRNLPPSATVLNASVEPIQTDLVVRKFFTGYAVRGDQSTAARYDVRSIHAPLFGRSDGYWIGAPEALGAIGRFVADIRRGRVQCGSPYPT